MLLLVTTALAAPLAPTGLLKPGVEVSGFVSSQTAWLRETGCEGAACDAWRVDTLVGGEVGFVIVGPLGGYAHGAWIEEDLAAAMYTSEGYAAGGGVRLDLPFAPQVAAVAWAGVEHQLTGNDTLRERASSWTIDAGAVLRAGRADEGIQGWVGAGLVPWSDQSAAVLDGDVTLPLAPRFPVEGVAGLSLFSEPLLGPWNDRTRLGAGVSGSFGYRSGVTGFLTFLN